MTDSSSSFESAILDVWFEGQLVGHIERLSSSVLDIGFTYARSWMGISQAFPISQTLPLSHEKHQPKHVYPWFMNLLPEGSALSIIGNILKVNELDVFAMLREMGYDLPGALEVRSHNIAQKDLRPRYRRLTEAELADAIRRLPERPLLVGEDGIHMSMAGAQSKLPVVKYKDGTIGLALDGAPSTHILKPANSKFHAAVENEAFCLRLAQETKLSAATASMHRVEDINYLLVTRYDRKMDAGKVRRIHQEDLCQATGYPPYLKYEWNSAIAQHGPTLKACMDTVARCAEPAVNKTRFLDYLLFNLLVGNVDAHSKNYSLLIAVGGNMSMAPIYDVMNGDIYDGVTKNIAMKVARQERADHIYGRHWDRFAAENGMSGAGVRRRVRQIARLAAEALPKVVAEMEKSTIPSLVYKEISDYIERRCRNMIGNLDKDPPEFESDDDLPSPDDESRSEGVELAP